MAPRSVSGCPADVPAVSSCKEAIASTKSSRLRYVVRQERCSIPSVVHAACRSSGGTRTRLRDLRGGPRAPCAVCAPIAHRASTLGCDGLAERTGTCWRRGSRVGAAALASPPMLAALRRLTLAQWRIIDETYLKRSPTHWRVPVVLLTVAACLILPRYFGRADFFERLPAMRAWMAHSAYPTLWPRLYWAGFKAINYLLVPMLVVRFVLRERVRDYGFGIRGKGKAWAL